VKRCILLVFSILIFSCEKDAFKSTGTITGADMALCACCGGYFIDIEGTQYRIDKAKLPGNFSFDDKKLPLTVELDWDQNVAYCKDFNWINVTRIKLR
jgi:hypothetical protein